MFSCPSDVVGDWKLGIQVSADLLEEIGSITPEEANYYTNNPGPETFYLLFSKAPEIYRGKNTQKLQYPRTIIVTNALNDFKGTWIDPLFAAGWKPIPESLEIYRDADIFYETYKNTGDVSYMMDSNRYKFIYDYFYIRGFLGSRYGG